MRKFLALAALVLGLASCQNEPEGLNVVVGGEQEVMLKVSLPEATRAADSALGFDLDNLEALGCEMRYILEIHYGDNYTTKVNYANGGSTVFPIRLVPEREYTFVVWADVVEKINGERDAENWSQYDLYYNTENGLDEVSVIEEKWNPMDEARDAYTQHKTISNFNSGSDLDMTLYRPFAKVRVVSTDIKHLRAIGIEPAAATAEYASKMHSTYNAIVGEPVEGEYTTKTTHTFAFDKENPYYTDEDGQFTLFADYFFVPEDGIVKFGLNVYEDANKTKSLKYNNFNSDIFVEANKLTTIIGDVLTTGGNIRVTVDGTLEETIVEVKEVATAQELAEAIEAAEEGTETVIEIIEDIDLSNGIISLATRAEPTHAIEVAAGKSVILNLNGKTLKYSKEQTSAFSMLRNNGTLTIMDDSADGTGKIIYGDKGQGGNYQSNTILNLGVMVINGGTIVNNSAATVAANGFPHPVDNFGKLTINGGTFTNEANYSSMRIWCSTDDDTSVTINGGTFNGCIDFHNVSAAANKGTLTINGGVFNPDTYTNSSVRLLGFGTDVDEMVANIYGGEFNGKVALNNYVGGEFNSNVFTIYGGSFATDPSAFIAPKHFVTEENGAWIVKPYTNGSIITINGVKAVVYEKENGIKAVSVEELNLNGKNYSDAAAWAEGLGNGWHLASIYELDKIWEVRKDLNKALMADNAENALFEEDDYYTEGKYALYLSSTMAMGTDPQGNEYFANRAHLKCFNLLGYWDYPYSTFTTTNVNAPLKSNYFARAVYTLEYGVGDIVEANGVKGIVYGVSDDAYELVSVAQGGEMTWNEAMKWAANLGEGWSLASLEDLKAIYNVRFALNDVLVVDNSNNALFEEDHKEEDGSYAAYWSSTLVEGTSGATAKAYYFYFDSKGRETTSITMFPVEYSRAVYTLAK